MTDVEIIIIALSPVCAGFGALLAKLSCHRIKHKEKNSWRRPG